MSRYIYCFFDLTILNAFCLIVQGLEQVLTGKHAGGTVGLVLDVLSEYMRVPKSAVPMFEETCHPEVRNSLLCVCFRSVLLINISLCCLPFFSFRSLLFKSWPP